MKITLKLLAIILATTLIVWSGINVAKYAIYPEYYSMKNTIATNPGYNDGFVCQGICVSEENGVLLVSGYMKDDSNSRIYVVDLESDRAYFVMLEREGQKYIGHAGGIATSGDTVYISNGARLYVFGLTELLAVGKEGVFEIGPGVPVNNSASYVFCDEEYIYVGEFHHTLEHYYKEHTLDDGKTKVNAIVSRYTHDCIKNHTGNSAAMPDTIFLVRDKVQGICFTPGGSIVLSTSFGDNKNSKYYVYDASSIRDFGQTLDGIPIFDFGECVRAFDGPAASEDLDYYNNRVITLTEYCALSPFWGKIFSANKINGLKIE